LVKTSKDINSGEIPAFNKITNNIIMYNNDSDSLNAGAPDIRLSGNQQMASMEAGQEGTLEDIYADLIAQGFSPREAAKRAKELYNNMQQDMAQGGRAGIMASAPGTYTQRRKQMMAGGGIAGLQKRQGYFLGGVGDFLGGIKDKIVDDLIPNELKENPVLTAALIGGGINQFGIPDFVPGVGGMGENWLGNLLGKIPGVPVIDTVIGEGGLGFTLPELIQGMPGQGTGIEGMDDAGLDPNWKTALGKSVMDTIKTQGMGAITNEARTQLNRLGIQIPGVTTGTTADDVTKGGQEIRWKTPLAIGTAIGAADYLTRSDDTMPAQLAIDPSRFATAEAAMADPNLRFKPQAQYTLKDGGRIGYDMGKLVDPKIPDTDNIIKNLEEFLKKRKDYEDRIMRAPKQEAAGGGLMNLGGMEKDYRNEGGFVALGGEEKADDVPARLSKNEFVFTADAVRGAGGGDIDKGAEIMEDLMNNLEGARGMFANAQKLQNRII